MEYEEVEERGSEIERAREQCSAAVCEGGGIFIQWTVMIRRIYPRIDTAKLQERTKNEITSIISHQNISHQATALPLPSWTTLCGNHLI